MPKGISRLKKVQADDMVRLFASADRLQGILNGLELRAERSGDAMEAWYEKSYQALYDASGEGDIEAVERFGFFVRRLSDAIGLFASERKKLERALRSAGLSVA